MTEFIQVTTTIGSKDAAQKMAESIVSERLAACVHVTGPMSSTYWWQGKIEMAEEWVCTAKTRKDLYDVLEKAIRAIHSYDEPEIIATPIIGGSQGYLAWLMSETTKQ